MFRKERSHSIDNILQTIATQGHSIEELFHEMYICLFNSNAHLGSHRP